MLLSKPAIERHIAAGNITVDPLDERNIGSAQIDVTLGQYFYRQPDNLSFYNPYDESYVRASWKLESAVSQRVLKERGYDPIAGVGLDEEFIAIQPGEMILAHTEEFIGGSCNFITTKMQARSTIGRNFLTVCACAGQGDVNFFNRWTFEIHNRHRTAVIHLVRGRRIGQILFHQVEPVADKDTYDKTGKYQAGATLAELRANWKPEDMLPKMWLDREARQVREQEIMETPLHRLRFPGAL